MGAYLGDEKFASGGGTTNVTAHQFTNSTTDIKANASSATLGVLDTIVRADHVHPFSDAETFAESERVKSNNASYGAIVHQKDMETYAQPIPNADATNIDTGNTFTTAKQYTDFLVANYPKFYTANIGDDATSNFKTLVGNPFTGANGVKCTITPKIKGWDPIAGAYFAFEVIAQNRYWFGSGHFAIGYLYTYTESGNVASAGWTGWTKYGS